MANFDVRSAVGGRITEVTKEDMKAADNPQWAPGPPNWPPDDPINGTLANLYQKKSWPAHVVNVKRPRFGRDAD
jgi:hypothetical protein